MARWAVVTRSSVRFDQSAFGILGSACMSVDREAWAFTQTRDTV